MMHGQKNVKFNKKMFIYMCMTKFGTCFGLATLSSSGLGDVFNYSCRRN